MSCFCECVGCVKERTRKKLGRGASTGGKVIVHNFIDLLNGIPTELIAGYLYINSAKSLRRPHPKLNEMEE